MTLAPSPLRPRRKLRAALLGAVAAVAIGAAVVETGAFAPSFAVADTQQPSAGPASFADVVDRVKSSVVSVKVKMDQTTRRRKRYAGHAALPARQPVRPLLQAVRPARRPGPGRCADAAPSSIT